jgi:hypothetical protein
VPAAAGVVTIEPAVAGKTVWTSNNALEFTATKPFDPEQTYTITVAGVTTADDVGAREAVDREVHRRAAHRGRRQGADLPADGR